MHSVRYLGVTIDDGLTWNGHVDTVTKEVREATDALWRSRRQLSIQSKLIFYFSIEAYVWLECLCSINGYRALNRLNRLSKSAIRDFYGLSRWTPTSPIFSTLGVRPLSAVMAQKIVLFVHRCLARRCSNLFRDHFVPVKGHQTPSNCRSYLSGQVPMVERQSSSIVLFPRMPSQRPCVWKRILVSFLPSSSACLRVPVSLNCHISSQLSNYRKVTLLLFNA